MRFEPGGAWKALRSQIVGAVGPEPAFVYTGTVQLGLGCLLPCRGREALLGGRGAMMWRLWGTVPLASSEGGHLDQSALLRWLAGRPGGAGTYGLWAVGYGLRRWASALVVFTQRDVSAAANRPCWLVSAPAALFGSARVGLVISQFLAKLLAHGLPPAHLPTCPMTCPLPPAVLPCRGGLLPARPAALAAPPLAAGAGGRGRRAGPQRARRAELSRRYSRGAVHLRW